MAKYDNYNYDYMEKQSKANNGTLIAGALLLTGAACLIGWSLGSNHGFSRGYNVGQRRLEGGGQQQTNINFKND